MSRKKFIFVKDAANDATYIDVDRVHDLEVTSATVFNINASDNEGGAINLATVTCSDSTLAIKELARLMSESNSSDIIVADDIAGIHMAHVESVASIDHS